MLYNEFKVLKQVFECFCKKYNENWDDRKYVHLESVLWLYLSSMHFKEGRTLFIKFQIRTHKDFVVVLYKKKNVAFTLISFAVLKWDDFLSVQVPFELPVQIPVQLLLDLEANWLDQNVNELEFELSRM